MHMPCTCTCHAHAHTCTCTLQPGSYDLSSGCRACQCNLGGSISQICDRSSPDGQCPCKPNIQGTLCTGPAPGFFFPTLDAFPFEAEDLTSLPVRNLFGGEENRGRGPGPYWGGRLSPLTLQISRKLLHTEAPNPFILHYIDDPRKHCHFSRACPFCRRGLRWCNRLMGGMVHLLDKGSSPCLLMSALSSLSLRCLNLATKSSSGLAQW